MMVDRREPEEEAVRDLYAAARDGRLTEYLRTDPQNANASLYAVVSGLVYERLTRRVERSRGHHGCAVSVDRLEPDCHDQYQDDVAAVHADLLRHAGQRIENLPGWLVPRLKPVTIDDHRRRRGARGAQQRPRLPLPAWLDAELGHDPWLAGLAVEILGWVGVPVAVCNGMWPLASWADRRARATGELGCTEVRVAGDVERVLAAMRTAPAWYEKYVERPLGRKQAPVASPPQTDASSPQEPPALLLAPPHEVADVRLLETASEAIDAIAERVRRGEDTHSAVVEVLAVLFGSGTGAEEMDCAPGTQSNVDERMAGLLADRATVDRIAATVLEIIEGH
jgi:hypothetical protein